MWFFVLSPFRAKMDPTNLWLQHCLRRYANFRQYNTTHTQKKTVFHGVHRLLQCKNTQKCKLQHFRIYTFVHCVINTRSRLDPNRTNKTINFHLWPNFVSHNYLSVISFHSICEQENLKKKCSTEKLWRSTQPLWCVSIVWFVNFSN